MKVISIHLISFLAITLLSSNGYGQLVGKSLNFSSRAPNISTIVSQTDVIVGPANEGKLTVEAGLIATEENRPRLLVVSSNTKP